MSATINDYNAALSDTERAIATKLQALITATLPEAEGKVWHRHPVWFLDGNPVTGYAARKNGLTLLFWSGQSFDEPALVASGSFKMAEYRLASVENISAADVERWLGKARDIQWDYKNLIKRKGELVRIA